MIDTLVIVVYNRLHNLQTWFEILKQCPKVRTVVIHNSGPSKEFLLLCGDNGAIYIPRENIGFDIGAFQDICMDRLSGFPEDWERLLWVADDAFPMRSDFLSYFHLQEGEGVRCMEISPYVQRHIRTSGFSIARSTAKRLTFAADPIATKLQCYLFEHRGRNTFLAQIRAMGLVAVMVETKELSPLWDTGYHRRLNRTSEFKRAWALSALAKPDPGSRLVTVICPIYRQFPAIISSMVMQTNPNWELWLINDGEDENGIENYVNLVNDDRIKYFQHEHRGTWGHSYRAEYLQKVKTPYTVITNADNQHAPVYIEYMLKGFTPGTVATYCSYMVHSYKDWQVIKCLPQRGYMDCAGVMLDTKKAQSVGWRDITTHSADWTFFNDLLRTFGPESFQRVKGCLLTHN